MAASETTWGSFRITSVQTRLRNLVSKEKRRFKDEKYDLDLTYINDKIIAMGFPSSGSEAAYRNSADDVYNFFEERHKDHYKFYNLCSERSYPAERFHGRVAHYPFHDHNPPPMGMFLYFCEDVAAWLAQDPRNVAAIHCKAGKGRTGVMITAYLMYSKEWEKPEEAMQFYGFARTNNQKGITIPSQRTFIFYWDRVLQSTAKHITGASEARRMSALSSDVDATVKAQIIAATAEHMKEGGEEDDSESDEETAKDDADAPALPPAEGAAAEPAPPDGSAAEQIAQLEALREAGHLTTAEFDEACRHVVAAAPAAAEGGGAAAADESADEDEEEDDETAPKGGGGGLMGGFMKFGFMKKKGLAKVADKATPKDMDPLMDRSWNDRNRSERPTRGQIPGPVLKCITSMRMSPTPKGGYEPFFKIHCGGRCYESKDMIPSEHFSGPHIDIPLPDIPVIDEVQLIFFRPGTFGKKKKILQFWFHVSFVEGNKVVIKKENMDKAIKDKKHKKYSQNFALEINFKDAPEGTEDPRRDYVVDKKK